MSLTYSSWQTSLANMLVLPSTDPNFQAVLTNVIDDAEQRIYRELDILNTIVRDSSSTLTTGTRNFSLPTSIGTFVVTENFNVITPASAINPENGTRNPLTPCSKEQLDFLWPSVAGSTVPTYFAPITQGQFIVGPWPDQAYTVEVVGTQRPAPLSSTNVTTLLSVYWPDVFLAASLVFGAGYLKNFGAMSDDPKSGMSWEAHYQSLMTSATIEEMRKKFVMAGWSSKQPAPQATPPRV